jgi:DNA-binding FrmR family transcriptional regulator
MTIFIHQQYARKGDVRPFFNGVDIPPWGMYYRHMEDSKQPKNRKDLIDRISRIEGQLRGIRAMIEEERGCVDVITQISAVRQSLASLGVELLKGDVRCKNLDEKYIKALFKNQ